MVKSPTKKIKLKYTSKKKKTKNKTTVLALIRKNMDIFQKKIDSGKHISDDEIKDLITSLFSAKATYIQNVLIPKILPTGSFDHCTKWDESIKQVLELMFDNNNVEKQIFWMLIDNIHDFTESRGAVQSPLGSDIMKDIIIDMINNHIKHITSVRFTSELFNCNWKESIINFLVKTERLSQPIMMTEGIKDIFKQNNLLYCIDAGSIQGNRFSKLMFDDKNKYIVLLTSIIDANRTNSPGKSSYELFNNIYKYRKNVAQEIQFFNKLRQGLTLRIPLNHINTIDYITINLKLTQDEKRIIIERNFPSFFGKGSETHNLSNNVIKDCSDMSQTMPQNYLLSDTSNKCIFPRIDKLTLKDDELGKPKNIADSLPEIKSLMKSYIEKVSSANNSISETQFLKNREKSKTIKSLIDRIYKALNIYLKSHKGIIDEDKIKNIKLLLNYTTYEKTDHIVKYQSLPDVQTVLKPGKDTVKNAFGLFMTMKVIGDFAQCLEAKERKCILVTSDTMQFIIGCFLGTMCVNSKGLSHEIPNEEIDEFEKSYEQMFRETFFEDMVSQSQKQNIEKFSEPILGSGGTAKNQKHVSAMYYSPSLIAFIKTEIINNYSRYKIYPVNVKNFTYTEQEKSSL